MTRKTEMVVLACGMALFWGSFAQAGTPQIVGIRPFGVQRGVSSEVKIDGSNLAGNPRLIGPFAFRIDPVDPKRSSALAWTFKLTVLPDVALGVYPVRVQTDDGLSNPFLFAVGQLPQFSENRPENKRSGTENQQISSQQGFHRVTAILWKKVTRSQCAWKARKACVAQPSGRWPHDRPIEQLPISPLNAQFRAVAGAHCRLSGGGGRFISKDRFQRRWKPAVNACPKYILSSAGTGATLLLSVFRRYSEEKQDENSTALCARLLRKRAPSVQPHQDSWSPSCGRRRC